MPPRTETIRQGLVGHDARRCEQAATIVARAPTKERPQTGREWTPPPRPIPQSGCGLRSPAGSDSQRDDLERAQTQLCLRARDVDQGGRVVEGALQEVRLDDALDVT